MTEDSRSRLARLRTGAEEMRGYFDVAGRRKALAELEEQSRQPGFWDESNKARETIEKANEQRSVIEPFEEVSRHLDDAALLIEMAGAEKDPAQGEAALKEAGLLLDQAEKRFEALELASLLNGRLDRNNAYLTLHAGAGGTESCDWTDILLRMYRRHIEKRGFDVEVMDYQAGDEAGVRHVTFLVTGPYAYGYMKSERGVHRLVRISPFDANHRRHTSFAALDVVAELDDVVEVEIDEKELRVDTYRSGGAGGQHVNKTESAVRLTHLPTGIVVACQAERSQHKNRSKAMKMLRAQIYEYLMDQKKKEMERFYGKKGEIAWGRQIRSYVLQPYMMVKDHRTGVETGDVNAVLDGDLQRFVEAYLKQSAAGAVGVGPERSGS
ncbi:MAG: peptide chain release factor 2 [Verrucomicrobiota bacterium]|nr:peptide chain release factor 2 [Verrucomicrobiota bacterium]